MKRQMQLAWWVRRLKLSSALVGALLVSLLAGLSTAYAAPQNTSAGADATPPSPVPTQESCYVTRVHLNGDQPPTVECLVQSKPTGSNVAGVLTPDTGLGACNIYDLQFFSDSNYQGPEICFTGDGELNLDRYSDNRPCCFRNWNDIVSSYKTGNYFGNFYADDNQQGTTYPIQPRLLCSWIGSVWNDRISSISIEDPHNYPAQSFC